MLLKFYTSYCSNWPPILNFNKTSSQINFVVTTLCRTILYKHITQKLAFYFPYVGNIQFYQTSPIKLDQGSFLLNA